MVRSRDSRTTAASSESRQRLSTFSVRTMFGGRVAFREMIKAESLGSLLGGSRRSCSSVRDRFSAIVTDRKEKEGARKEKEKTQTFFFFFFVENQKIVTIVEPFSYPPSEERAFHCYR